MQANGIFPWTRREFMAKISPFPTQPVRRKLQHPDVVIFVRSAFKTTLVTLNCTTGWAPSPVISKVITSFIGVKYPQLPGFLSPFIGVILELDYTPFITNRGPPCRWFTWILIMADIYIPIHSPHNYSHCVAKTPLNKTTNQASHQTHLSILSSS